MTEQLLALPTTRQPRLLWRLDGGFGTDGAINWLLPRGCRLLVKGFSARLAGQAVHQVAEDGWLEVGAQKGVTPVATPVDHARRTQTVALNWMTPALKEKATV